MRRPIGKRIEQVCAACEESATFSEIAFLMGLENNTGNVFQHVTRAVDFGFVIKTGQRNTARYIALPDWKQRIEKHNSKPQAKELPDYAMVRRYTPLAIGRVNSIFNMGAMA